MEICVKSEESFLCFLMHVPRQWPASGSGRGSRQGGRGSEHPCSGVWSPQPRKGTGSSVSALLSRSLGWMVTGPLKGEPGWLVWGDTAGGSVRALSPTLARRHLAGGGLLRAKQGLWQLTKRPALATCFIPTKRRWGPFTSSLTPGSAPSPPHLTSEEGLRSFPTWSRGPARWGRPFGLGLATSP